MNQFNDAITWERDPLTHSLLQKLQSNQFVDSREYLKPIFRWMKPGTKYYDLEKAFEFANWIVHVSLSGCGELNIPVQKHLIPQYAFNAMITMAQRASNAPAALRAFNVLKGYNYCPDIFSYTALLDVVGRKQKHGIIEAMAIYNEMLCSRSYPNIVTFVTMLRLIGMPNNTHIAGLDGEALVVRLLDDAIALFSAQAAGAIAPDLFTKLQYDKRWPAIGSSSSIAMDIAANIYSVDELHLLDITLYNSALSATVRLKSISLAKKILSLMQHGQIAYSDLTLRILGKLAFVLHSNDVGRYQVVDRLVDERFLSDGSEDAALVLSALAERINNNDGTTKAMKLVGQPCGNRTSSLLQPSSQVVAYSGCLGPDASEALRSSVMMHDTEKLLDRITNGLNLDDEPTELSYLDPAGRMGISINRLVENDFVTLIHQCRKRKWPNQVSYILEFMLNLWKAGLPAKGIPPQPQLRPTIMIYESALDAYFSALRVHEAWVLWESIFGNEYSYHLTADEEFVCFVVKGFLHCGDLDKGIAVYALFLRASRELRSLQATSTIEDFDNEQDELAVHVEHIMVNEEDSRTTRQRQNSTDTHVDLGIHTSIKLARGLMRGCGGSWVQGIALLKTFCDLKTDHGNSSSSQFLFSASECEEFVQLLIESIAVLGHGVESIVPLLCQIRSTCQADIPHRFVVVMKDWLGKLHGALIVPCLQCTICTGDPSAAHRTIHQLYMNGFIPKLPFWHSIVAEALASTSGMASQYVTVRNMNTLPFDGFLRVGAVKYLDSNRQIIYDIADVVGGWTTTDESSMGILVPKSNSIRCLCSLETLFHIDLVNDLSSERVIQAWIQLPDDHSDAAIDCNGHLTGSSIESEMPQMDAVLQRYLLGCSHAGSEHLDFDYFRLRGILLVQHINFRLLQIRNKAEKQLLQKQLLIILKELFVGRELLSASSSDGNTDSMRFRLCFRELLCCLLHGISYLGIQKQGAKILVAIFDCLQTIIDNPGLSLSSTHALKELVQEEATQSLAQFQTCLDILRDVNKYFSVFSTPLGCRTGIELIKQHIKNNIKGLFKSNDCIAEHGPGVNSEFGVEKIVRIVEFIKTHGFLRHMTVLERDELEEALAVNLLVDGDSSSTWSAVTTYFTVCKEAGNPKPSLKGKKSVSHVGDLCSRQDPIASGLDQLDVLACCNIVRLLLTATRSEDLSSEVMKVLVSPVHVDLIKVHNLCRRLLVRLDLADVKEFRFLFSPGFQTPNEDQPKPLSASSKGIDIASYLEFSLPSENVYIILAAEEVEKAVDQLLRDAELSTPVGCISHAVGIDVEWKPYNSNAMPTRVSLLQLGTQTSVYLFDLVSLHHEYWDDSNSDADDVSRQSEHVMTVLSRRVFQNSSILKLGFGLLGDVKRLCQSFPRHSHIYSIDVFQSVLDLLNGPTTIAPTPRTSTQLKDSLVMGTRSNDEASEGEASVSVQINQTTPLALLNSGGLSQLCSRVLGKQLDKSMQCSDWERRPLLPEQITYAALDAHVLVLLFLELKPVT